MNVRCSDKAAATKAKTVLLRAGYRYSEHGPFMGSPQITLMTRSELDQDTIDELQTLPGVTVVA